MRKPWLLRELLGVLKARRVLHPQLQLPRGAGRGVPDRACRVSLGTSLGKVCANKTGDVACFAWGKTGENYPGEIRGDIRGEMRLALSEIGA